jgi:hypothetical protein
MTAAFPTLSPAGLNSEDLTKGRLFLRQTRDGLVGSVRMLTETQWTHHPGSERWSVAEIVAHIISVQRLVLGLITDRLASAPPPPPDHDRETIDSLLIGHFSNRLSRFPSPLPTPERMGKAEALRTHNENCAALTGLLESVPHLREHALEAPPLRALSQGRYSAMDGYQWILAAAGHTERHTKQILELIASDTFPAH